MASSDQAVRVYSELAEVYHRRGEAQMRDRYLVLAADAALATGQRAEGESLRARLLQHNPHHLLKPYATFAEAMRSTDVQNYVAALRRSHPFEKAEHLLESIRQTADEPNAPDRGAAYRVVEGGEESRPERTPSRLVPHLSPTPKEKPMPDTPRPRPASAGQPAPAPASGRSGARDIYPVRREPLPRGPLVPGLAAPDDRDSRAGSWVSLLLFWLMLPAALVLAGYTLLHPFLPRAWLP